MKWEKKGKLCDSTTWNIEWYRLNIMCPVPVLLSDSVLRVYVAMCDSENRGRVGYIDVDPDDPSKILGYSETPVLDIGETGRFDENGVLPTAILNEDGKMWMYYCGFQKHVNYPYTSLLGLAYSEDKGNTFHREHEVPILDRRDGELFIRTGAEVIRTKDNYKLWYASGNEWLNVGEKLVPRYNIKYLESSKRDVWAGIPVIAMPLQGDEYGMTIPQVLETDEGYKMFFSVRSLSNGYRMAYAESKDGIVWDRKDREIGITVSDHGFDDDMICFGKCFRYKDRTYMFYCGNHYGIGGLGWALLKDEE